LSAESAPPVYTSVTLIETINENRSEPPTICPRRAKGVVTTRAAAEDRLPNRGCAGGVTIMVTGSHSYRFFLQHEEFEFLFLVDFRYRVLHVWNSEVERLEMLVVEKS
jgi:hypothetical protein